MNVLIACEFSAVVRDAFRQRGHNAWSCDLLPCEGDPKNHHQGDVLKFVKDGMFCGKSYWDMMIAHPPCTYLSSSGLHWNCRTKGRAEKTWEAIKFVEALWDLPIEKKVVENPIGCLPTFSKLMKATQIIQPYEYGHDASKATCLWIDGVPSLVPPPAAYIAPRIINGKERWGNQTDSGQNKLAPSEDRWAERSITYQGIANAMAEQWG